MEKDVARALSRLPVRPHLRVRLERQLVLQLREACEKSCRTLTGEIAERLRQSFAREDQAKLIRETIEATIKRNEPLQNLSKSAYDPTGW